MNSLEKKLKKFISDYGKLDYPGGKIQAFYRGKKIVDLSYGKVWPIYDLASLTKILFSTTVLMQAVERKTLSLNGPVQDYLPWYKHKGTRVYQLLNHSAGNAWWYPFYKDIDRDYCPEDRFCWLQRMIREKPIKKQKQAVYSDVDFFLLGSILERVLKKPLIEIWRKYKEDFLPKSKMHFCYDNKSVFKKNLYAPTEKCSWRKMTMQGQVHDENAWALGGVAPHAGLFGEIADVSQWALLLRQSARGSGKGLIGKSTLAKFTKASMPASRGSWGLGFMKPSVNSTAGKYFSSQAFGHTGFTGMSLWMDPKRDLIVVLCSNRVHPTRENRDFIVLRPQIHDLIVENLKG